MLITDGAGEFESEATGHVEFSGARQLRRVVMFPDDGHPDLCAAVHNLTGDLRDEVFLWDQDDVWIFTQDRRFEGEKIYAPEQNPRYNDSNYRINVSWPVWQDAGG